MREQPKAKGGQPYQSTGISNTPVEPTLAQTGIDKNLAKRARPKANSKTSKTCCTYIVPIRLALCN